MKIFKNFISLFMASILLIPALPHFSALAETIEVKATDYGKEYILYEENFNTAGIDAYLSSSDGYSVSNGAGTVIDVLERANGDYALNVGIDNSNGTTYKFKKTFSKTWSELLSKNGITPEAGDFLVFYLDVCAGGANTYLFTSDYADRAGGNMGMFKGATVFRDAKDNPIESVSGQLSKTAWYKLNYIYKFGASNAKHFATIFNGQILTDANSSNYRTIPLTGLPYLSFDSNWGVAKFDNIRVAFVKNTPLSCEVPSDGINPFNQINLKFDRKVVSGELALKDGDTVIESSASLSGASYDINLSGSLECGKTYTVELKNVKDIYGNITASKTLTLKTAGKTNIAADGAIVSELKNISVLVPAPLTPSELSGVSLSYTDAGGNHEIPVQGSSCLADGNGNITLNIPITENLRTATAYTVKIGTEEIASFTTKDGVNVSRPVFTEVSDRKYKAAITADNVTGYANVSTATIMLMYFEGDRLVKIETSPVVDITASAFLNAEIDLASYTLGANSRVVAFVTDNYTNMYPLSVSYDMQ